MEETFSRAFTPLFLFAVLLATDLPGQGTNVSVTPRPEWVRPRDWSMQANPLLSAQTEATRYLLFERQENPELKESFTRLVLLMENQSGVQESGSLTIGFDPNYQELRLHHVQIHRHGTVLNRLDRSKVKLIQPEPDLDGHVFTGRESAVLFVEDLRVGDALEYDYTIRGANPIMDGHFSTRITVQSGVAIEHQRVRVLSPAAAPLKVRQYLTETRPRESSDHGLTEWDWDFDNLDAIPYEDDLPMGYEPYPYLEFSDFEDWASVANWALPLYPLKATNLPHDLLALIKDWQSSGSSAEQKARSALDFVQDELRYTGLELGPDSYRAADPQDTFQLRYGDCKGKALLLCAILRQMGLEAYPALVNTFSREAVAQHLPSPFVFNHAIVRLQLDGKIVWVDPTRSHQGGSLWGRHLPPYGRALVVSPGSTALEDIPASSAPSRQLVTSTFYLKDNKAPARMTVLTAYYGPEADTMRGYLAATETKEITSSYLNFYATYYPGIRELHPFRINDQRSRNVLELTEEYEIKDFWKKDKTSQRSEAAFYPENLIKALIAPSTRLRKMPLRLPYPMQRQQEMFVHLPDGDWNITSEEQAVDSDGFTFHFRREMSGSVLHLHYDCATKTPVIAAARVPDHLKQLDEMENLLGDTLQRPESAIGAGLAQVNWLMVVIAGFGLLVASGLSAWFWRATRLPGVAGPSAIPPLVGPEPELRGLGGWLVLVGIGLCAGLVTRPALLARSWEGFFTTAAWQATSVPGGLHYHPLFGPLLIFELLGNIVLLATTALALGLFFTKRKMFPRVFIALLVGNVLFLLLDELTGKVIPYVEQASHTSSTAAVARAFIMSSIWCSYMLISRRVKATFVR